jgi:hypothetical protein
MAAMRFPLFPNVDVHLPSVKKVAPVPDLAPEQKREISELIGELWSLRKYEDFDKKTHPGMAQYIYDALADKVPRVNIYGMDYPIGNFRAERIGNGMFFMHYRERNLLPGQKREELEILTGDEGQIKAVCWMETKLDVVTFRNDTLTLYVAEKGDRLERLVNVMSKTSQTLNNALLIAVVGVGLAGFGAVAYTIADTYVSSHGPPEVTARVVEERHFDYGGYSITLKRPNEKTLEVAFSGSRQEIAELDECITPGKEVTVSIPPNLAGSFRSRLNSNDLYVTVDPSKVSDPCK